MTNYNINPSWEVTLYGTDGKLKAILDNYEGFVINKKLNDVGSYAINFIDDGDERLASPDYWQLDGLARFERDMPYFVGDKGETYTRQIELDGLFRKRTSSISDSGERKIIFEGVSPEHLLSRRVIAANEGTTRADKDDAADDVMCQYVSENCGYGATPESGRYFYADYGDITSKIDAYGVMPGFSVSPNSGIAPNWVGTKSMENLLDAIKDIGRAKKVDFAVLSYVTVDITNPNVSFLDFRFTVWPDYGFGVNRSASVINLANGLNLYGNKPVLFSIENDNVQDVRLDYDRMNEINFVFILGQGEMSTRSVYPAENVEDSTASPWNQIEVSRSSTNSEYVYQLSESANEALSEGAYLESIDFTPFQTPSCFYGYHYFLGDIVSVKFDYALRDYRIVGVTLDYGSEGEKVTLQMESPTREIQGVTPNAS